MAFPCETVLCTAMEMQTVCQRIEGHYDVRSRWTVHCGVQPGRSLVLPEAVGCPSGPFMTPAGQGTRGRERQHGGGERGRGGLQLALKPSMYKNCDKTNISGFRRLCTQGFWMHNAEHPVEHIVARSGIWHLQQHRVRSSVHCRWHHCDSSTAGDGTRHWIADACSAGLTSTTVSSLR